MAYTWLDWVNVVKTFLPVDATRKGAETFLANHIRQGVLDIQALVPFFNSSFQSSYTVDDVTFDGWASLGEAPEGAIIRGAWVAEIGNPCNRKPVLGYDWAHRNDLICAAVDVPSNQVALALEPRAAGGQSFVLFPALAEDYQLIIEWDGTVLQVSDSTVVPFTEKMAYAVALWVKAAIAKEVDGDEAAAKSWRDQYLEQRRMLYVAAVDRSRIGPTTEPTFAPSTVCACPATATPETVDFVAVGDTGTTDAGGDSVANLIKGLEPDFILFLGDICHNAGAETLLDAQYTQKYGGFTPLDAYPAWGNHDLESASGGLWGGPLLDLFAAKPELAAGKFYYNFTKGPCEIFVLNSGYNLGDPREPDGITAASVQAAWLQAALAASSAPWKIVACHIAPYCSDSTHGSTAYMQWPFLAWGASLVLSGHSHVYERLVVGGLPYLVTGLGGKSKHNWGATVAGSQKRYNALYGVVRVTATEARLQCRFINELGQTYDRVIYEV